jgi:hypothetical protein
MDSLRELLGHNPHAGTAWIRPRGLRREHSRPGEPFNPTSAHRLKVCIRVADDLNQMPSPRRVWRAWDRNVISVESRRLIYLLFAPVGSAGLIVMLVVGEWVAAGFMAAFLVVALEAGARSPGTRPHRLVSSLRRRT